MNLKIFKVVIGCILIISIVILIIKSTNKNSAEIYFMKLDNADCTIVKYSGQVIVIDTGEKKDEKLIKEKLKKLNINCINYMILTHPDKDHIGSANDVIKKFEVQNIIQSGFNKGSDLQKELTETIESKKIENIIVNDRYEIKIDDMIIEIYGTKDGEYKKSNDNSLVTIIKIGKRKICLAGDIEKDRIKEIEKQSLIEKCDILKVPHHGKSDKMSEKFIKKVEPKYAIITSKKADDEVLKILKDIKSKVYYTSNAEIKFMTNGKEMICKQYKY